MKEARNSGKKQRRKVLVWRRIIFLVRQLFSEQPWLSVRQHTTDTAAPQLSGRTPPRPTRVRTALLIEPTNRKAKQWA